MIYVILIVVISFITFTVRSKPQLLKVDFERLNECL